MTWNRKGQIAIEYLIFIAIFLLFFQAMVNPSINFAENVINDVQSVAVTQENVSKLADNISAFASSMGTGRVTMGFYLPKNATLASCSPTEITYLVKISEMNPKPVACLYSSDCNFSKKIYIGTHNITCDVIGPGFTGDLIIEKNSSTGDFDVSIK